MGTIARTVSTAAALAGLASASQMPEFAQQYRQRLGGALEELRIVVADFDRDAAASNMTRDEALESFRRSSERFPQERALSMQRTISRFENLTEQNNRMEDADPVVRAAYLFANPDTKLLEETWSAFEPAVPLNMPGAVWGGAGALAGLILAGLPAGLAARLRRRRNQRNAPSDAMVRNTVTMHGVRVDADSDYPPVSAFDGKARVGSSGRSGVSAPQQKGGNSLLDQGPRRSRVVGEIDARGRITKQS